MGWVVGTRGFLYIGRQLGGSFVGSSLDFCRYARCTPVYCSAGIGGRAKQIFGAKPLKTRDQPTDELICFPCDAAFFVFFFPFSFFFFFFSFFISFQQSVTAPPPRHACLLRSFLKRSKSCSRHLSDEIRYEHECKYWIDFTYIIFLSVNGFEKFLFLRSTNFS